MTVSLQNASSARVPAAQVPVHPKGWREVQSLVWLGLALYLALALLTYSPLDPGWSRLSSDTVAVSNSAGVAGSWLADLFFSFLGKAAFLLPVFMVVEVLAIWRPQTMVFGFGLRWLAKGLLLVATTGLFALHDVETDPNIINAAGGIVGLEVGQSLLASFGLLGSTVLMLAVVILNGTLVTGFSWNLLLEALGYGPYAGVLKLQAAYRRKLREYREHKQQTAELSAAEKASEQQFQVSITNEKVQAQLTPAPAASAARIEPSLGVAAAAAASALPTLAAAAPLTSTETPQLMAELNEALSGFTQEMVAITPEMLAGAAAAAPEIPAVADFPVITETVAMPEPTQAMPVASSAKQQQLADELSALLADAEQVAADIAPVPAVPARELPVAADDREAFADVEDFGADDDFPVMDAPAPVLPVAAAPVNPAPVVAPISARAPAPSLVKETVRPIHAPVAEEPLTPPPTLSALDEDDDVFDSVEFAVEPEPEPVVSAYQPPVPQPVQVPVAQPAARTEDDDSLGVVDDFDLPFDPDPAPAPVAARTVPVAQPVSITPAPVAAAAFVDAPVIDYGVEDDEADDLDAFLAPAPAAVTPAAALAALPPLLPGQQRPLNQLPSLDLLEKPDANRKAGFTPEQLERLSRLLEIKLKEFNIDAKVVDAYPGPVITRFEVDPAPGVKVSKISNIAKDLARSMAMMSVRVVEVIPGKTVIGIEVPNENRQIVRLQEILSAPVYQERESPVTMALGKDISGKPVAADMARMPHLLVAGTTGSGKSVGVNTMIISLLYKSTPEDVRLILIDPKMLELSIYDKIPHLLTPVVTDMKDAANALRWCVAEMERRYKLMSAVGVRNLAGFNKKLEEFQDRGENILDPLWKKEDSGLMENAPKLQKMPFIVVVIDEFADMMMIVGKKVEELIARIAQKARAAGIHLILATQRPSVDVITGLIKANVPSRIAFQVSSKIDSRTILDQGGAEQLLGNGDMLFQPVGTNIPERIHGAFVSDDEVHRICDHWRSQGAPNYVDEILEEYTDDGVPAKGVAGAMGDEEIDAEQDVLYDDAVAFVLETRRASISFVQRKFKIGYNRAARLIEAMEMAGLVSPMQNNGQREVLIPNNE